MVTGKEKWRIRIIPLSKIHCLPIRSIDFTLIRIGDLEKHYNTFNIFTNVCTQHCGPPIRHRRDLHTSYMIRVACLSVAPWRC